MLNLKHVVYLNLNESGSDEQIKPKLALPNFNELTPLKKKKYHNLQHNFERLDEPVLVNDAI